MIASSCIPAGNEAEDEISTVPNWLQLPIDVTTNILQRVPTIDIVTSACLVCPLWWNICKDPLICRTVYMSNLRRLYYSHQYLLKICRYAVERSCGHLENIYVHDFGSDDLLQFIADNGNNLRCIRLVSCSRISDKGMSKAVRKIPLLEELDISYCNLSNDSLEAVGLFCPLLKSFKFSMTYDLCFSFKNFEALVIPKTMSGLRHLDIEGNYITDYGLAAILDGCPLLESLNIQDCFYLEFRGSLKERCLQQIKDIRLPFQYRCEDYISEDSYSDSDFIFYNYDSDPYD